jgi:hypothetical protein
MLFQSILELSQLSIDRRYENPNDAALAVLLWIMLFTAPELVYSAADLVDRAPQSWYARKLAQRILVPPESEGANKYNEVLQKYLDAIRNLSGDMVIDMNLITEPIDYSYFKDVSLEAKQSTPNLVEAE